MNVHVEIERLLTKRQEADTLLLMISSNVREYEYGYEHETTVK